MQPLKIVIPGTFYDTQLYMGRLHVWRTDGTIATYDWNKLIERVKGRFGEPANLLIECAFKRGDYLYGQHWDLVFRDNEIRTLLIQRFEQFAREQIILAAEDLQASILGMQDSPLPFPHADSIIFKRKLYTVGPRGLYLANCDKTTKKAVSTVGKRLWDCPTFGLAKSRFWGIAIAAGEEGVYECRPSESQMPVPSAVEEDQSGSTRDCTSCEWMFFSIYSSSHSNPGYMVEYRHQSQDKLQLMAPGFLTSGRYFSGTHTMRQIFDGADQTPTRPDAPKEYSWGTHDKICRFANQRIDVMRFNPWAKPDQPKFQLTGSIPVMTAKGEFVGAQAATFGFVVEFDNCLVVLQSDTLKPTNLWGEPVNWRVFRHSKFYTNQLHVIYNDRLEIFSFNQDYFEDQSNKIAGYTYSPSAAT
jgi:hypothetical protein